MDICVLNYTHFFWTFFLQCKVHKLPYPLDKDVIAHTTSLYLTTGDKWTLSPVIIYNEDSMLHPQNITMEGIGRTVQLLCVGSKVNQTKSVMVKKKVNLYVMIFLKDAFSK